MDRNEFSEFEKWYLPSVKITLDEFIEDRYSLEPNNDITRSLVRNYLRGYFEDDLRVTGFDGCVREFKVVCDETNNPPSVIDYGGLCWNVYFTMKNGTRYKL